MNEKWDEAKLLKLIEDGIEESGNLEYKAAGALAKIPEKKLEITKDVSAFANSAGGVLIYGIQEHSDPSKKHLPEKITPIDRQQFSKEWLEQIISQIQPRMNPTVTPVTLAGNSNVAYVVEIEPGMTAHQAADLKYYKRYNFQAVAMQDYEIRDVMRRRKHPTIKVELRLILGKYGWTNRLWWRISNTSEVFARHVMLVLRVPISIRQRTIAFDEGGLLPDPDGSSIWRLTASNANDRPLFPGSEFSGEFKFSYATGITNNRGEAAKMGVNKIAFRVFADEMPAIDGSIDTEPLISISDFDQTEDGKVIP